MTTSPVSPNPAIPTDASDPSNPSSSSLPSNASNPPKPPKKKKKKKKLWVRIILFTLRLVLVPFLCLVALYVGLVIGYVRIGGQPYSDIFDMATWKHLYELVYSKT